ncbi:MAG: hypothetical protein QG614_410 [Patescibacteria group bacterium]|nr:hypothetical protein [Patescibacteria group bacterium]
MSKLYKKVKLLVSRGYCHGGDGLENLGLWFFHSMEEYEAEANKNGWKNGKSFKSSWYVTPVEVEAWVRPTDFVKFKCGEPLNADKVLFATPLATKIHQLGWWQG